MTAGNKFRPYTRTDHYQRDAEIYRLRVERGWTLERIGKRYKITRERVRQIYRDYRTKTRHYQAKSYQVSLLDQALRNLRAISYQLKCILEP